MLDNHALLPLFKKELPGFSDREILEGIEELAKAHPDLTNVQAIMALNQSKQGMPNGPQSEFSDIEGALDAKPSTERSNG